ncbi:hypothetical protein GGF42_002689 [Coemansia sp. RSA 2424]|nr:hypothetical protein GGF42_002689 [Coemansia sp. RSA 2424]
MKLTTSTVVLALAATVSAQAPNLEAILALMPIDLVAAMSYFPQTFVAGVMAGAAMPTDVSALFALAPGIPTADRPKLESEYLQFLSQVAPLMPTPTKGPSSSSKPSSSPSVTSSPSSTAAPSSTSGSSKAGNSSSGSSKNSGASSGASSHSGHSNSESDSESESDSDSDSDSSSSSSSKTNGAAKIAASFVAVVAVAAAGAMF